MKTYKQLFLEIANSTDYKSNKLTGASWRYYIDESDKRVYVQFQETKTFQDWIFNFLLLPVKLKLPSGWGIKVPLGNYLQFKSVYKEIFETVSPYLAKGYMLYVTGWSQGGVTAGEFAYWISSKTGLCKCIMYGTPKFLRKQEDVNHYEACVNYVNFLYPDDPIREVIPEYQRPLKTVADGFTPDFPPVTLDDKHRIYGHSSYEDFDGKDEF